MSETDGDSHNKGSPISIHAGNRRSDEPEYNELSINLRISYKTLLLAFVLFDVLRNVTDSLISLF